MAVSPDTERKPWRLFVAVELPPTLRDALRGPLEGLTPLKDWMRPSPVQQIHLTLHFLGGVDHDRVAAIVEALTMATRQHRRFELVVRGIGAFGGMRRPRVLWAGFADTGLDNLRALRHDTSTALARLGLEVDADFKPHLTLGRARRPLDSQGRQALRAWSESWKERAFGALPVTSVALMRSQLGGGPARHSTLATCELQ